MAEVVVALDVGSVAEAVRLADALPGLRWAKVGPSLYVEDGPRLVRELTDRGIRVFLDLKWHDIPTAVARVVGAAAERGIALATVHALGGREMLGAAVRAARGMRLAAVSVLTSHTARGYREAVGRPHVEVDAEVLRLARLAVECGVGALVASPREAAPLRAAVGAGCWIVTPGIRPPGAAPDDQRRTASPQQAVAAGATHLVVGRPIVCADEPALVYQQICEDVMTEEHA